MIIPIEWTIDSNLCGTFLPVAASIRMKNNLPPSSAGIGKILKKAKDIGIDKDKLKEKYNQKLTIKQGVKLALSIFKELKGKEFEIDKFELVYIDKDKGKLKRIEGEELKDYSK